MIIDTKARTVTIYFICRKLPGVRAVNSLRPDKQTLISLSTMSHVPNRNLRRGDRLITGCLCLAFGSPKPSVVRLSFCEIILLGA